MRAFVDSEREGRVSSCAMRFRLHLFCPGFFRSDERAFPSWVVHPLQSLPRAPPSPYPVLRLQSGGAWRLADEGIGDARGAAGDSRQSRDLVLGPPLARKARGSQSPIWRKYPAAPRPTSQNLSVCCVCVHTYTTCVGHTRRLISFLRADYIYIYDVISSVVTICLQEKKKCE